MSRRKILLTGFLVVASVINLFMIPTGFAQPKFTLNSDIYLAIPQSHSVNISIDRGQDSTYFIDDPIIIRYGARKTGYINIFDYTRWKCFIISEKPGNHCWFKFNIK